MRIPRNNECSALTLEKLREAKRLMDALPRPKRIVFNGVVYYIGVDLARGEFK